MDGRTEEDPPPSHVHWSVCVCMYRFITDIQIYTHQSTSTTERAVERTAKVASGTRRNHSTSGGSHPTPDPAWSRTGFFILVRHCLPKVFPFRNMETIQNSKNRPPAAKLRRYYFEPSLTTIPNYLQQLRSNGAAESLLKSRNARIDLYFYNITVT